MDGRFHERRAMSEEELQLFTQNRILQEQSVEDFYANRDSALHMDAAQLHEQYGYGQEKKEAAKQVTDMPEQRVDEKESRRMKREKKQLQKFTAEVEKERHVSEELFTERSKSLGETQKPDKEAEQLFEEVLHADIFTPKNVLENLPQVVKKLDEWDKHLKLFQGEAQRELLMEDQRARLDLMSQMHRQGTEALQTALGALGYACREGEKGFEIVDAKLSAAQRQQMQEKNRELRTQIAEGGAEMNFKVADVVLEGIRQQEQEYYEMVRRAMRDNPDYAFLSTEKLNNRSQYEKLLTVKELLDAHSESEEYRQNDRVLSGMYEELIRLMEAAARAEEFSDSYRTMTDEEKEKYLATSGVKQSVEKRLEEYKEKSRLLLERADTIEAGIRHILGAEIPGRELTEEQSLSLEAYLPKEQDVHQKRREEIRQKAKACMDRERQVHDRAAAEAAPGDNGNTEAACLEYVRRVQKLDTSTLQNCKDEELIARAEELQNLCLAGAEMSKQLGEIDLAELLAGETGVEKEVARAFFEFKCKTIQAYADKAGAATLIQAYRQGALDEDCFQPEEIEGFYKELGRQKSEPLSPQQLLILAKRRLEKATAAYDSAANTYYAKAEVRKIYRNPKDSGVTDEAHPRHTERRNAVYEACAKELGEKVEKISPAHLEKFFGILDTKIEAINKRLQDENLGDMENLELLSELQSYREYRSSIQQEKALVSQWYVRAGDKSSQIKEMFMRPYNVSEWIPAFREMSEDEYEKMCARMSAGMFEKDSDKPERLAYYREENRKGLLTYKQRIAQHYEMLEEKFHHRMPSLEYIEQNKEQLAQWFSHAVVDAAVVDKMRDVVDLTDPADCRLYHQVHYYIAVSTYISHFQLEVALGTDAKTASENAVRMSAPLMGDAADYLEKDIFTKDAKILQRELEELKRSGRSYANKQRWRAEMEARHTPLMAEKFRQLVADSDEILQRGQTEQLAFVQRVAEMADHMEQYGDVSSASMKQLQAWMSLMQDKVAVIATGLYRSRAQVYDNSAVLGSGSAFARELDSREPHRFLNALCEMNKQRMVMQVADVSAEELAQRENLAEWKQYDRIELEHAIDKMDIMPDEFQTQFMEALYGRKEELLRLMESGIAEMAQQLPGQPEERQLLATFLVWNTELGKEYDSLNVITGIYFRSARMMEKAIAYQEGHTELLNRAGELDAQLAKASKRYRNAFHRMGYGEAVGKEHLKDFRKVFHKEEDAKLENPYADAKSYDMVKAAEKEREPKPEQELATLIKQLSELQLTEEMLTPEYMESHMEQNLEIFGWMDRYREQMRRYYDELKGPGDEVRNAAYEKEFYEKEVRAGRILENKAAIDAKLEEYKQKLEAAQSRKAELEARIPAVEKKLWERQEDAFRKYRDYVSKFARSHCADIENARYLTKEAYEAEKEQLPQELSRDRKQLENLLGGFAGDGQQLQALTDKVAALKNPAVEPLREAGVRWKDLIEYLGRPIRFSDREDEKAFRDAAIFTVGEMCAKLEEYLEKARTELSATKKESGVKELLGELQTLQKRIGELAGKMVKLQEGVSDSASPETQPRTLREYLAGVRVMASDLNGLTPEEIHGLEEYAKDVEITEEQRKKGADIYNLPKKYQNINNSLRGIEELKPEHESIVEQMKSAFSHARLPENMTLYRATSKAGLGAELKDVEDLQLLVGKTFVEPAFMSTAERMESVLSFYDQQMFQYKQKGKAEAELPIILKIEAEAGAKVLDISGASQYKGERERLFDAGQKLLITDCRRENYAPNMTRVVLTVKAV